jgi:hypothetical protein
MKSFQDFKVELVEEEKSDYSKFDVLVRAGLANKAQMQRIHRILDKMQDDRPNFNNADKQIIQNLFNKMVDLVSNNKQIFNQTRRAVREELEEGVVDTSDYKVDASGRKYKAHRTKVGDTAPQVGDDPDAIKEEAIQLDEGKEPPFVLVLKRKAIRVYPDGTKIALYYNDKLKRIFTVPSSVSVFMSSYDMVCSHSSPVSVFIKSYTGIITPVYFCSLTGTPIRCNLGSSEQFMNVCCMRVSIQ